MMRVHMWWLPKIQTMAQSEPLSRLLQGGLDKDHTQDFSIVIDSKYVHSAKMNTILNRAPLKRTVVYIAPFQVPSFPPFGAYGL